MAERILYHGTDILIGQGNDDIIGLVDHRFPEISGNLTNDIEYARRWALRRSEGNPDWARVLVFRFDDQDVVDLGPIDGHNQTHGFATTQKITPHEVPESYLLAKRMLPSMIETFNSEIVYFYRASRERIVEILTVES